MRFTYTVHNTTNYVATTLAVVTTLAHIEIRTLNYLQKLHNIHPAKLAASKNPAHQTLINRRIARRGKQTHTHKHKTQKWVRASNAQAGKSSKQSRAR